MKDLRTFKLYLKSAKDFNERIWLGTAAYWACTNKDCQATYTTIKYKCDKCKSKVVKVNPEFQNVTKSAGREEEYVR